ncbi:hypothetical protein BJF90_39325 [Pseudonocardia sp. CNS-004]|nr:hypothetical protein BJF90_39325 [Pseudonocardia sp. CNS-004]
MADRPAGGRVMNTLSVPGTDPFPTLANLTAFGHCCYSMGENGETVLVVGHGRRARAAVNAWRRMFWPNDAGFEIADRWAVVHTTCGCTEDQHREHEDSDDDCGDACAHPGLAPCTDRYEAYVWWAAYVDPATPGAIAVTVTEW